MSHCANVHQWMLEALDRGLSPEATRALQAHLQACPRCRATWASLQEVDHLLSTRPLAPVPTGFAERTLARLSAPGAPVASRTNPPRAFWLAASAALVVLPLILFWWATLLGIPVLLWRVSPSVWSGLRLGWEALIALVRSLDSLVGLWAVFCREMALAAATLALFVSLAAMGRGLRRARLRA